MEKRENASCFCNTNINIQSNLQKPTNLQLVLNVVLQVWSRSYCRLSGRCLFCPVVSFATSARNDFEDADSDVHCHLLLFCQSKPPLPKSQRLTIWPSLHRVESQNTHLPYLVPQKHQHNVFFRLPDIILTSYAHAWDLPNKQDFVKVFFKWIETPPDNSSLYKKFYWAFHWVAAEVLRSDSIKYKRFVKGCWEEMYVGINFPAGEKW